jgi:hypothetical protein
LIAMPLRIADRIGALAAAAALQVVALVLAHELVFLARYGSRFGEALVHSGHGEAWTAAVYTSLALAVGLGLAGAFRLARLGLLMRARGSVRLELGAARSLDVRSLLRAWLRLAPKMALFSVVLLSIQENVEHWSIGQAVPGPGILLSDEYPDALWITIAVALAVSLVAALFEWRRRVLLAQLRAARGRLPRASESAPTRPGISVRPPVESLLGRQSALRAPPEPLVS